MYRDTRPRSEQISLCAARFHFATRPTIYVARIAVSMNATKAQGDTFGPLPRPKTRPGLELRKCWSMGRPARRPQPMYTATRAIASRRLPVQIALSARIILKSAATGAPAGYFGVQVCATSRTVSDPPRVSVVGAGQEEGGLGVVHAAVCAATGFQRLAAKVAECRG